MNQEHTQQLLAELQQHFGDTISESQIYCDQLTIEINPHHLVAVCTALRDESAFHFESLMDLCGVDYSCYGVPEWETESTTATGFSRAVERNPQERVVSWHKPRFAVVYHLLSYRHNQRLRIRVFPEGEPPTIASVVSVWASANWYEREAFDLFGIIFQGHPDLRRILTDYGFIGHPFRKDFPLIGNVEMRYDAALRQCVYEPVSIQSRTLVPKVIRTDNRYQPE